MQKPPLTKEELCAMIRAYWHSRGYPVEVITERRMTEVKGERVWADEIVSDTVNGWPKSKINGCEEREIAA